MLRSPNTSRAHSIPHQWVLKRCTNPNKIKCVVCSNLIGFLSMYEKCKCCKLAVHTFCRTRVCDNCGLTAKHVKELITKLVITARQNDWAIPRIRSKYNANSMQDLSSMSVIPIIKSSGFTSWKDVTIPFNDIQITSLIGKGRFGEVHKVQHFGTVAIKLLYMNHVEEQKRLEVFKQDTACFQNARHENIVFFCGYTMDTNCLGIVMELIKGQPLYYYLHDEDFNDKRLDFNDILDFAQQICQGMSYLHTRHILHKDLRSKNVFIKERKVVITDYGIFNVKKLSYPKRKHSFLVPQYWLCYIAPELIKLLSESLEALPFSELSDVYAFGTIWFELLTMTFPFLNFSPDSIIWHIGNGMKSALCNVNSCREAKVLLMKCWAFHTIDRYTFTEALKYLEKMPKKLLRRSPSFSICKSYESIF